MTGRLIALLLTLSASSALSRAPVVVAAAQEVRLDTILVEARNLFAALDYEGTVRAIERLLPTLEARAAQSREARLVLAEALEMRARSRFGLADEGGARADFALILKLTPTYALPAGVSPRVGELFEEVKVATLGQVVINITPPDAEVELDGAPVAVLGTPIPVAAGSHRVTARRPGYRPRGEVVEVAAAGAADVMFDLERTSAILSIVTTPAGAEVIIDGVSRGTTEAGTLTPENAGWDQKLGVPASDFSRPFIVADLPPGSHVVELRRQCHTTEERKIEIAQPIDYPVPPVKLARAIGAIQIDSKDGGVAFLDNESRGATPLLLQEVCQGPHVVEVRSQHGRYVRRLDVRPGDKLVLEATVKPAFAILSTSGLPEGLRGGPDLRLAVERALGPAQTITAFAPTAQQVDDLLKEENLAPGWLAFDALGRPLGAAAINITPAARRELSARMSQALGVQGVAAVTVPPGGARNELLITLLGAGSGEPDVLTLKLDDPESASRAVAMLNLSPGLFRPSVGMFLANILDLEGPAVIKTELGGTAAQAGIAAGDVILSVDGEAVKDVEAFNARLATRKTDDRMTVQVKDAKGASKAAELTVVAAPRAVAMQDRGLLFNKLMLELRYQLATATNAGTEAVLRLNLAVSLMRAGNWAEALGHLRRVTLPQGPGVSAGTVQYLTGLCQERLGQAAEAEKAFREAMAAKDALLTEDGPPVSPLAEQALQSLRRPSTPG